MKKNTEAYRFLEIIQQHELLRLEGDWDESFQDEKFMEGNTWKKYLEGYETVRHLSREEKEAIPAFAALRELWMIAVSYTHLDVYKRQHFPRVTSQVDVLVHPFDDCRESQISRRSRRWGDF